MTIRRKQLCYNLWGSLLKLWLGGFFFTPCAYAEGLFPTKWKLTTPGAWPVVVVKGKVILKNGNTLSAYRLKNGEEVWRQSFPGLRYGERVLAGGREFIYVLNTSGIIVIEPEGGRVIKSKTLKNPDRVFSQSEAVYLTGSEGVFRFDPTLEHLFGQPINESGELLEVSGRYAALLNRTGPKAKLLVVDFDQGKKIYQFTLMPSGDQQLVFLEPGKIIFIDYSRRDRAGKNQRVLFYTEVDLLQGKKLRDISLSKKYSEIYPSSGSDSFSVATDPSGILFLGNHGAAGDHSSLQAYDPLRDKLLWSRSGEIISAGVLLHRGVLWSSLTQKKGQAFAVAYNVDDGHLLGKEAIDSPAIATPLPRGSNLLLRTSQSIYCFSTRPRSELSEGQVAAKAPRSKPPKAWPGWRLFRDQQLGYYLQVPKDWRLEQNKVLKLGGIKMSVPFVHTRLNADRLQYLASVHVLSDRALGRDVNALWQSIFQLLILKSC